ncbi:MAG: hypothetical protein IJ154_03625 [Bacteroidales bacterium]|nr:hypothetical protein [Bacteroidales bacterium]
MDRNSLKTALSAISLLAVIIAVVCYFAKDLKTAFWLTAAGIVCKVAELIVRFTTKKNSHER